jgi:cytochrome P450
MENTLFLQSEVQNPFEIYCRRLKESPVYLDQKNNIVAIYSYDYCNEILHASQAYIPPANDEGLNEMALFLKNNFARTNNPPAHAIARQAAIEIFNCMKPVPVAEIMEYLVGHPKEMEWVSTVCKKLPVLYLLKSFDFNEDACRYFLQHIESLTKIMLPKKTAAQIHAINAISNEVYQLIETQILKSGRFSHLQHRIYLSCYVSNLAGLLIQGFDACRGLLSNSLLQVIGNGFSNIAMKNKPPFIAAVTETLRFDPPVHNTRRVLNDNIALSHHHLEKGQDLLLVLAAANRDPAVFHEPQRFDPARENNHQYLSFGAGTHACPAHNWTVRMASEALFYLYNKFSKIILTEPVTLYEPAINLRLPVEIRLDFLS